MARSTACPRFGSRGPEAGRVPGAGVRVRRGGGRRPGLPIAEPVQHAVHVVLPAQALEEWDEVQQLRVRHVIEPGLHRHLEDRARGAGSRPARGLAAPSLTGCPFSYERNVLFGKEARCLAITTTTIVLFVPPAPTETHPKQPGGGSGSGRRVPGTQRARLCLFRFPAAERVAGAQDM